MGKKSHLKIIQQGSKNIREWLKINSGKKLDISNMIVELIDFTKINFKNINCDGTFFSDCKFYKTNFRKVHLKQAEFSSDFDQVQFKNTVFENCVFFGTMKKCNFQNSMIYARFMKNIIESDFTNATFVLCKMHTKTIENCCFKNSLIQISNFNSILFYNVDFLNARIDSCGFDNCNFNNCKNLSTIECESPSSISFDTISNTFSNNASFSPDFKLFVEKSGIPEEIFTEIPRILKRRKYYSTFISYGSPDFEFARKLHRDLTEEGVPTWFYPFNKTLGRRIWHEISEKRMTADRMIVICSIRSLIRDGVKKEIEEQIDENPEKLIPISLDMSWKEEGFEVRRGGRDLKPWLIERNYANFEKRENYDEEFKRLLDALRIP